MTLRWRPTDPIGQRWELWLDAGGERGRFLGRILRHVDADGATIVSLGYFTDTYRDSRSRLMPSRWYETIAPNFHEASRRLVSIVKRITPASTRSKRGVWVKGYRSWGARR